MSRSPKADQVVQITSDPAEADSTVVVIGDQVITATPADDGKVVTVDENGNLVLEEPTGGGNSVQPGDDADTLGSGAATDGQVLTADGDGNAAWEDATGGGTEQTFTAGTSELVDAAPDTTYINSQQAVYDAESDTTFVSVLGVGRDCYALAFHHATGKVTGPVFVGTYPLPDDDNHGNPAINIDHDGYLHIFWGAHALASGGASHRYSKSTTARSVAAWSTTTLHAGTYPSLVVADNGDLLVFDRAGTSAGPTFPSKSFMGFRRSTDGGATWDTYKGIISVTGDHASSRVYPMGASIVDGVVHLTWTVHRGATSVRENVYHAIFDPVTETLTAADGTDLGAQITWAEHPTALVATASPVPILSHFVQSADDISIAFHTGTAGGGFEGDYTWHVARWTGTAWSTVDTEIPVVWTSARATIARWGDGYIGLFPTNDGGAFTDLAVYVSPDGAAWYDSGVLIAGDTGEGWGKVVPVLGDRWLALAQQMPTGWDWMDTSAGDMLPVVAIEYHRSGVATHNHDADYATDDHTHAGLEYREVAMTGSGVTLEPVTNTDETDWLYGVFT